MGNCMQKVVFLSSLVLSGVVCAAETYSSIEIYPKVCNESVLFGPRHLFSVQVFCDDAAGTTIGVISRANNWKDETDRFWSSAEWSRDVNKIKWAKDGKMAAITSDRRASLSSI